ncbi:DNA repair protein RecO [Candidatus Parcubacteria bacterium]|nr:DNA repair protein RecO [Candidatus Parcubacteria bacterium]
MFTHYRTQGIIIKKIDKGEAARIFTIYTRDFGKLKVLAKAERKIKSKLRAGLELFYLSEIEFIQGKNYKTLTDVVLIDSFQSIREDLERLKIAYKISEILDNFIKEEQADKKIWGLLSETFDRLNNLKLEIIYYYFLWNFFSILGYQPELYLCSICQNKLAPEKLYFSYKDGGIICSRCFEKIKSEEFEATTSETVKILRLILKRKWEVVKHLKIENKNIENLKNISNYYISELQNNF